MSAADILHGYRASTSDFEALWAVHPELVDYAVLLDRLVNCVAELTLPDHRLTVMQTSKRYVPGVVRSADHSNQQLMVSSIN